MYFVDVVDIVCKVDEQVHSIVDVDEDVMSKPFGLVLPRSELISKGV